MRVHAKTWQYHSVESNVTTSPDIDIHPGPPIPGGSRWIKITTPHPGQVIKVKRSNGLSVFYVQERAGVSQGRNSRVHQSSYREFLRDFEPYTKRDWNLAKKVMAVLENPTATVEAETPETAPGTVFNGASHAVLYDAAAPEDQGEIATVDLSQRQADIDVWDTPAPVEEAEQPEMPVPDKNAPPIPSEEAKEIEAEAARRWRTKPAEFSETEMDEIVDLWRSRQSGDERVGEVTDWATTYGTAPSTIYAVISNRVPQEYLLQRVVDQLKRNEGPIPAYRISQWMHLKKDEVEALCTSEEAQQVLRYTVEVNDPARPWIKTPMVELLPTKERLEALEAEQPVVVLPEPEPVVQEPIQEEIPVATVSPAVEEAASMPEPTPITTTNNRPARKHTWRLRYRTEVEELIEGTDDLTEVVVAFKQQHPGALIVEAVLEN
jgi:hypothetical protein